MATAAAAALCLPEDRDAATGALAEELAALPLDEVWRVRLFAGLRTIVHEHRARGTSLVELFDREEASPAVAVLPLLDARALARLGVTRRQWRTTPQWNDLWFLLGRKDFGATRRLVPRGGFERFDEVMLEADTNWDRRYRQFVAAANCPSIEVLRIGLVRVAQAMDIEHSGLEEVRLMLARELQLGPNFLSLECVEQLLEDVSSLSSIGGGGSPVGLGHSR